MRDHSIRARLAKAKEQSKQPTVVSGKSTEPTVKEDEVKFDGIASALVVR